MKIQDPVILLFMIGAFLLVSQLNAQDTQIEDKADSIALLGLELMDEGNYLASIEKLEAAKKILNKEVYDYEIGLAYYQMEAYEKAKKIYSQLVKSKNANPTYFTMLGNSYDMLGKAQKALKVYENGLKKFPDSGPLHLELGVVMGGQGKNSEALNYWEKGLTLDPFYSSNYYWAAKTFLRTKEKLWALLYGEIFLNLEYNSVRTEELSPLIFDAYFTIFNSVSDSSGSFELTERGFQITISPEQLENIGKTDDFKLLPFSGQFALDYSVTAPLYFDQEKTIDRLIQIKSVFLEKWNDDDGEKNISYPNALIGFWNALKEAGHLRAYHYFIFRFAAPEAFENYLDKNELEVERFAEWYAENQIPLAEIKHSRLQY